jgi:hypothetical protein
MKKEKYSHFYVQCIKNSDLIGKVKVGKTGYLLFVDELPLLLILIEKVKQFYSRMTN